MRELDSRIHAFSEELSRRRWIAGQAQQRQLKPHQNTYQTHGDYQ
jgi:hypothetical protein